jgi:ubiquitin carboxyl-terminal hydrolase 4/11/15
LPDIFELDYFKAFNRIDPYKSAQFKDSKTEERKVLSITDCLRSFSDPEELDEFNAWYCKKCQKLQTALKRLEIYKAPDYFMIQLKRFKGADGTRWNRTESKITDLVTFPVDKFDMSPFMTSKSSPGKFAQENPEEEKESGVFQLFGVLHHTGTLNNGHCVAHAKHPDSGDWYLFNDDKVTKVTSLDELVTETAYVLFYKRINH